MRHFLRQNARLMAGLFLLLLLLTVLLVWLSRGPQESAFRYLVY